MSAQGSGQFKVCNTKKSPFAPVKENDSTGQSASRKGRKSGGRGPSGSRWKRKHLDWLHIKVDIGVPRQDLYPPESDLGNYESHIRPQLEADWNWICNTDHEHASIFTRLQTLAVQDGDLYTESPPSQSPSSNSAAENQSMRDSKSPRSDRHVTPDRQHTIEASEQQHHFSSHTAVDRKRPREDTPSPPQRPRVRDAIDSFHRSSTSQTSDGNPDASTSLRLQSPEPLGPRLFSSKSQTTPEKEPYKSQSPGLSPIQDAQYEILRVANGEEAADDDEEEEEEEEEEEKEEAVGPSKDASDEKPEITVAYVGSSFLDIVCHGLKAAARNGDPEVVKAQEFKTDLGLITKTSYGFNVTKY